ncbi:MAG TPA: WcaF family extracellular polysaccharide biosynthesis acetyltransferase [Terracidiphilus sp.]|jgi:putative colanic acid biosynthesis acetyltransferase WcaF
MLHCEQLVDLSLPDNSLYDKGRSLLWRALWHFAGFPVVRCYWLPVSAIKVRVLRLFGARIGKGAYLKPGLKVKFPWYLTIGDHCWIGEDVWIDNLAQVTIGSHVCISQGAYLCTGNHDWKSPNMKLFRRPIKLQDGCWVGARATLCPGVVLGIGATVTVGSVASGDIPAYQIWAGNPARYIRDRKITKEA